MKEESDAYNKSEKKMSVATMQIAMPISTRGELYLQPIPTGWRTTSEAYCNSEESDSCSL